MNSNKKSKLGLDIIEPKGKPLVSIITVTHNRAHTLRRAILSVKRQTYALIQIVLIDGGSTDDTLSILHEVLDSSDVILSEPDTGMYDALNKGLTLASGHIVGILHSDDLLFDEHVIKEIVCNFSNNNIDMVYGDAVFFKNNDVDRFNRRYRSGHFSIKNLSLGFMPAHPTIYLRREIYHKVGLFDTTFKIAGDFDFLCRLAKIKDLRSVYIRRPLVRMQSGGLSSLWLNKIRLNFEVLRALKKNDINYNIFVFAAKYAYKIFEFIK